MNNIIKKIRVGGITNIAEVNLPLEPLTALVAPNNYGKSNLLVAVEFATRFLTATPQERQQMMGQRKLIPINASMDSRPFEFEVCGTMTPPPTPPLEGAGSKTGEVSAPQDTAASYDYEYGYRFEWATTKDGLQGRRITGEWLRAKGESEPKFRSLLRRESETDALMAPTPTSRCNKPLAVDGITLALDRLGAQDKLFFAPLVSAIRSISVQRVNTIDNPDGIFSTPYPQGGTAQYSTAMPRSGETGYFINSLRRLAPDNYELLRSTLLQLLPDIEDFEPVQVDLSERADVPFQVPNTYYDIRVKERANNQYTSINSVSTGCKKILYVLTMALAASMNGVQLLMFEELENSVHPRLLQSLLQVVDTLAGDTKVITTSHSPFLVKYLRTERIYLGLPTKEGVADFRTIKPSKVKRVMQQASSEETSVGEYLFELMLDVEADEEMLDEYFV